MNDTVNTNNTGAVITYLQQQGNLKLTWGFATKSWQGTLEWPSAVPGIQCSIKSDENLILSVVITNLFQRFQALEVA